MGFIYGLAVFLVIFEGIIIQCDGARIYPWEGGDDTIENESLLPTDLIELILSKTDYKSIRMAELLEKIDEDVAYTAISRMVPDRIIQIVSMPDNRISEYYKNGDLFLKIGPQKELNYFFNKFGDQVKRVEIEWYEDEKQYKEFNKIIIEYIKIYGKNFEELRIKTASDVKFWKEILDGEKKYDFPKVKKFQIHGDTRREDLNLKVIFPKLEIFTLYGHVANVNYLTNVETLKELTISIDRCPFISIKEDQLQDIFKKNKNITKISLAMPEMAKAMHLIAENLKQLTTLRLETSNRFSLLQENHYNTVYQLPSVTNFYILFYERDNVIDFKHLSFVMPHLKELTLNGFYTDDQIVDFVEHFEELEKVAILGSDFNIAKCIEKLKNIKEFTTHLYKNRIYCLNKVLPNFNEHFKLQILKFRYDVEYLDKTGEAGMMKFKNHLETSMKTTWTQSYWEQSGTHYGYLIFKREP